MDCVCLICFVWALFELPEPIGRTAPELDILVEKKISARKFSRFAVAPFRSNNKVVSENAALVDKYQPQ
jgi:SP family general alpha glucoside:H+ symporter-like MFS transporter